MESLFFLQLRTKILDLFLENDGFRQSTDVSTVYTQEIEAFYTDRLNSLLLGNVSLRNPSTGSNDKENCRLLLY